MLNFFIERPVFSTVIALVMILVGTLAAVSLPIAQYPQVVPPQVTVTTSFAGANADVVSQSVAASIEQQVNGSQDMLYMSSKSGNDGFYSLTVTFDIGTDKNIDAIEVQNRVAIAQSQLPADVIRNGITVRKSTTDFLEVISLTSPERKYDAVFLSNYALLNLYDALGRVPGVGQVRIFGARDYSMRIWLNPERMARVGVTASDIANVVREQNVVAPSGGLGLPPVPQGQQMQYTVFVRGRLAAVSEFENIVIREAGNGQVVRLRDVARVELAAADYSISGAEDDIPAALIGIFLQPDANALEVAKQIKQVMEAQAPHFPPGMVYSIPYSTTPFVTESLKEVIKTLLIAFVLVVFVVYLFLQSWRATLIPVLVVPISLVGTFGAFAALGFSINTLTLFGLVLAIGIVVDDAIVVVEAVQQRLDAEKMSPMEATKSAIADVGGPVIAIALVLAAVFVPVAFLGGLTGQLYKQFALTLAVSVILSAICALTFTPAMCALLLIPIEKAHPRHGPLGWFFAKFNSLFERSRNGYVRSASVMERHAVIVMLTFGVLLIAVWGLISTRPTGLVPPEDQGYVLAVVSLPPAAALERTNAAMSALTHIAREVPGVDGVVYISGFNLLTGQAVSYNGTAFIRLKPWDQRKARSAAVDSLVRTLMGRLNAQIKDAQVLVLNPPPIRGLSTAGGFTFVLQSRGGADTAQLSKVLQDLLGEARKRPEIGFVYSGFDPRIPQIEFEVDRDKVKSLGIQLSDVFFALQTFLGSYYINDFNLFGRTYRVQAQAEGAQRGQPDDVNRFYVRSDNGTMVPLSTLVSSRPLNGPQYFERYNVYSAATINGTNAPGYSSGQAIAAMEELARALPAGFAYEWSEATYQEKKTGGQTGYIFAVSLLFVILVLAALYESWAMPVAILLVIPFGVFGAFLGLFLRSFDNNVYTQIGLIMLVGLAAKNAILIVEFARLKREQGESIEQAALDGAKLRLRPILMTSFAFILGTVPLALATGAGAGARDALGTAVVFGMLVATLVGVFFIPVFYVLLQRVSERQWPFKRPDAGTFQTGGGTGRASLHRLPRARTEIRFMETRPMETTRPSSTMFDSTRNASSLRNAAAALLLAASLSACMVGPDYRRPEVEAPAAWRLGEAEAGNLSNVAWWDQFQDPELSQLVRTALENNKDLKIATANIDAAVAQYGIVHSAQFPQVNAGASADRERGSSNALLASGKIVNDYALNLSASFELDLWGKLRRATESARASMLASEQGKGTVVLTVVTAIATGYIQLRALDRQLDIAHYTSDSLGEAARLQRIRFEEGAVPESDFQQAESQYRQAVAQVPELEREIARQENLISALLGRNPGPIARGRDIDGFFFPAIPADLPSTLLERRPDIRQAEQQLIAANADIGVAKAAYFPDISLTGLLGLESLQFSKLFVGPSRVWSFGANLAQPIFNAGRIQSQVDQAEALQREALYTYEKSIISAFQDVENALVDRSKFAQVRSEQARNVAALRRFRDLAELRYREGATIYLEVANAEQSLFNAELAYVSTQAQLFQSYANLYKAMGGGWVDEADRLTWHN